MWIFWWHNLCKLFHFILDSGAQKRIINSQTLPHTYHTLPHYDDLWLPLAGTTRALGLVAFTNICFPECNWNMVIDDLPTLTVDLNTLYYNVIFGANFLDMCAFHLDYDHYIVNCQLGGVWVIPLWNTPIFYKTFGNICLSFLTLHRRQIVLSINIHVCATCILDGSQDWWFSI